MAALLGRLGSGFRSRHLAVELALDFAPEAITLHERAATGCWRKFASAQLDDPEFPVIIGLLRTEAESRAGRHGPVRLWLPGDQILKLTARIDAADDEARLHSALDQVRCWTTCPPDDVAVAVSAPNRDGETTILVAFAETCREARQYATRWGFVPGAVSTRHHAADFGAEGPVFRLRSDAPPEQAPASRYPVRLALGIAAALAVVPLLWWLLAWEPDAAVNEAVAPAALPIGKVEPMTAAATPPVTEMPGERDSAAGESGDPTVHVPAASAATAGGTERWAGAPALPEPSHVAEVPVLAAAEAARESAAIRRPQAAPATAAAGPGTPASLRLPAAMTAPPRLPVRFEHDPVAARTRPLAQPRMPLLPAVRATGVDAAGMMQPEYAEETQALMLAAVAPQPGPVILLPEPSAGPGQSLHPAPSTEPIMEAAVQPSAGSMPEAATPLTEIAEATPAMPPDAADGTATGQLRLIHGKVPPPARPARGAPPAAGGAPAVVASDPDSPLAKILPPPRPAHLLQGGDSAAAGQRTQEAPRAVPDAVWPDSVATAPADPAAGMAAAATGIASPPATERAPAASRFAALIAPRPPVRPAQRDAARQTPGANALPMVTTPIPGSVRSAATEPGLPLGQTALIGVVHVDGGRKALLRLPDGRYRSVVVGDLIEGWRVSMIGADAMRITRGGEDRTLLLVALSR